MFELATDGPGFLQDETYEHAGEILSLPPHLQSKRKEIEEYVRPFDTSDANKNVNKENTMLFYSAKELTTKQHYKFLTGSIIPRPIAWITTINQETNIVNALL